MSFVRYAGLCTKDARGHEIRSRLELQGRDVALLIDDQEAAYPLTISPILTSPSWTAAGNQADARFGHAVATAADVNGDGYSEVIVGAFLESHGQTDEGRAYVCHGSIGGLSATPGWTAESNNASASFGYSVGTAGDVNGDGYSDVIIGAIEYDIGGGVQVGRAYAYHGNSGGGLDRIPGQVRVVGTNPIWLLGRSDAWDGFRLRTRARTAGGRGKVSLQYEAKPLGVAFNGSGLVTGLSHDTGAPGTYGSAVPLSEVATGLEQDALYHWRLRAASSSPYFPWSPWCWLPYNGVAETDVRTARDPAGAGEGGANGSIMALHLILMRVGRIPPGVPRLWHAQSLSPATSGSASTTRLAARWRSWWTARRGRGVIRLCGTGAAPAG